MPLKVQDADRVERMRDLAVACARKASDEEFHVWRGAYGLICDDDDHDDGAILVIFDNAPPKAGFHHRDQAIARFRQRIDQLGHVVLASASWPPPGEDQAGYTVAVLIDNWDEDMQKEVCAIYKEEIALMVKSLIQTEFANA
jgi:hypothetical protein